MKLYLLVAIIFGLMAWVGTMSYTDAVNENEHYTRMVCAEVYPDYLGIEPDCDAMREKMAAKNPRNYRRIKSWQ